MQRSVTRCIRASGASTPGAQLVAESVNRTLIRLDLVRGSLATLSHRKAPLSNIPTGRLKAKLQQCRAPLHAGDISARKD